jgi:hypothetical protein
VPEPPHDERAGLQGHELVVHVYIAATGPRAGAGYAFLCELWQRCRDTLDIDRPEPAWSADLPAEAPPVDEGDELLAVRTGGSGPLRQLAVRRLHDVFCLSLLLTGERWPELSAAWTAVPQTPPAALLGTVRILQARLASGDGDLGPRLLGPVVEAQSGIDGDWDGGHLRAEPGLGPFAVWEVLERDRGQAERDGRPDRRIVVVAPADRDPEMSAWTWSRGDAALTPFGRYLLHAAKLRYLVRLRAANQGTALRRSAQELADGLLPSIGAGQLRGDDPADVAQALAGLRAVEIRLVRLAGWLRDLRRTAGIAARNMARHAGHHQAGGLFADDKALAEWLDAQLDNDLSYLEAPMAQARGVIEAADRLVPRDVPPATPRRTKPLRGGQKKQLLDALVRAYPTYEDLELLLDLSLDRKLPLIVARDGHLTVVYRVIDAAETQGWTQQLIDAAIANNPGNPELQELVRSGLLDA